MRKKTCKQSDTKRPVPQTNFTGLGITHVALQTKSKTRGRSFFHGARCAKVDRRTDKAKKNTLDNEGMSKHTSQWSRWVFMCVNSHWITLKAHLHLHQPTESTGSTYTHARGNLGIGVFQRQETKGLVNNHRDAYQRGVYTNAACASNVS